MKVTAASPSLHRGLKCPEPAFNHLLSFTRTEADACDGKEHSCIQLSKPQTLIFCAFPRYEAPNPLLPQPSQTSKTSGPPRGAAPATPPQGPEAMAQNFLGLSQRRLKGCAGIWGSGVTGCSQAGRTKFASFFPGSTLGLKATLLQNKE